MNPKIKEVCLAITGIDQQLLVEELKDLKTNLSLELQAVRDERRLQYKEFQELMAHLYETLREIQVRFHVDAQVLNLIRPEKAGEDKWQISEGKSNSSQSHMLK